MQPLQRAFKKRPSNDSFFILLVDYTSTYYKFIWYKVNLEMAIKFDIQCISLSSAIIYFVCHFYIDLLFVLVNYSLYTRTFRTYQLKYFTNLYSIVWLLITHAHKYIKIAKGEMQANDNLCSPIIASK